MNIRFIKVVTMDRIRLIIKDEEDNFEGVLENISLVSEPAIEENFFYFGKTKKSYSLRVDDKDERKITGPSMIPNKDIFRLTESGEEYYVYFNEEDVKECAEIFFKHSDATTTNLQHKFKVDGVIFFESWIVDKANGKGGGKNFEDIPDGSWMVTAKIDNDEVWNSIVSGEVKGFSIEGAFAEMVEEFNNKETPTIKSDDEFLQDIKDVIESDLVEDDKFDKLLGLFGDK